MNNNKKCQLCLCSEFCSVACNDKQNFLIH